MELYYFEKSAIPDEGEISVLVAELNEVLESFKNKVAGQLRSGHMDRSQFRTSLESLKTVLTGPQKSAIHKDEDTRLVDLGAEMARLVNES